MQQSHSKGFLQRAKATGKWLRDYWGFVFLLLAAIAWVYIGQTDKLNRRAKYAIGYNAGRWNIGRSGIHYFFHFTVADSTYEGASLGPGDGMHMKKGFRFIVKYDSLSPGNNIGYFEYPVPDSIRQAPPNGWLKPPFPIAQWILDRDR